ncbi:MAG: hypothetical protein AB7H43_01105 [Acidimicrobiia bacterium]
MKRKAWAAAVGLLGMGLALAWAGSPAGAQCAGPDIFVSSDRVGRGATFTVTGEAFGTACYDTGPPPAGQGALGEPAADLELVVEQADRSVVVALGSAGSDYGFTVDVVLPVALVPGPAELVARSSDPRTGVVRRSLTVLDQPAAAGATSTVALFGAPVEAQASTASGIEGDEGEGEGVPTWLLAGTGLAILVAGAAMVRARRR